MSTARTDAIRNEVQRHLQQKPFQPFALTMENGDRVIIEHPENIAFDPTGASPDFYVLSARLRLYSTFEAVTAVALRDTATAG
jgi:hypothetical protein